MRQLDIRFLSYLNFGLYFLKLFAAAVPSEQAFSPEVTFLRRSFLSPVHFDASPASPRSCLPRSQQPFIQAFHPLRGGSYMVEVFCCVSTSSHGNQLTAISLFFDGFHSRHQTPSQPRCRSALLQNRSFPQCSCYKNSAVSEDTARTLCLYHITTGPTRPTVTARVGGSPETPVSPGL